MTRRLTTPVVADISEPGVSKDSRENFHDTSTAVAPSMVNAKHTAYQRLVVELEEVFGSAIEPYVIMSDQRLTGRDIHNAVMEALENCKSWRQSELSILDDFQSYASGSRPVYLD